MPRLYKKIGGKWYVWGYNTGWWPVNPYMTLPPLVRVERDIYTSAPLSCRESSASDHMPSPRRLHEVY